MACWAGCFAGSFAARYNVEGVLQGWSGLQAADSRAQDSRAICWTLGSRIKLGSADPRYYWREACLSWINFGWPRAGWAVFAGQQLETDYIV